MTLLQKLSWAKALPYDNINCHGLKPVAIDRWLQGTLVPFCKRVVHPWQTSLERVIVIYLPSPRMRKIFLLT